MAKRRVKMPATVKSRHAVYGQTGLPITGEINVFSTNYGQVRRGLKRQATYLALRRVPQLELLVELGTATPHDRRELARLRGNK